jgi:single-strand DNA-binding protein
MADLNRVMLMGNLTRDPDVRYTPKGSAVADLGMAINSSYRTVDGQVKEEVCYVDVVVWGRQAETCKEYLTKGSPVFVEGRLQYEQWETKEGEKRNRLKVKADRVQFLGRGSARGGGEGQGGQDRQRGGTQGQGESTDRKGALSEGSQDQDIAEDDIPF